MHKKQTLTVTGISALGAAAALLAGCGGNSFSKNSFGSFPNTLPYAYGVEPVALNGLGNNQGNQAAIEGSGIQGVSDSQAYITAASAFTAVTPLGATLPHKVDPAGGVALPVGFSTGGKYIDAGNQIGAAVASVAVVPAGTSIVFRAALANGSSSDNTAPGITSATLTSTDPQFASIAGLTAGIPMSLNVVSGPFSNATYVDGTGGTPLPFTIPASTPSGLYTMAVTVGDTAGRVTSTTFVIPVVAPANVALFAQNVTADGQPAPTKDKPTVITPITAGDTVTIDGAAGTGTYPAAYKPNIADPQGTVVFFVAPGTHILVDTTPVAATKTAAATTAVTTQTIVIPATAAGTTLIQ